MRLKIDSLNPSSIKVGWEGSLEIIGRDLGKAGFASIDGHEPKVESWSSTRITVKVTKDITKAAGEKRLVVHDKDGNVDNATWTVKS
jgi:hypothetical protein